jgi:hypothetical protein
MVNREELVEATWDFLNSVVDATISRLGSSPTRIQRSNWMDHTGSSTGSSDTHERTTIDTMLFEMLYVEQIHEHLPTEKNLWKLLLKAGIPDDEVYGGFLISLLRNWLRAKDPFTLEKSTVSPVIALFADAVINKVVTTQVKNILVGINLDSNPIILEDGVRIRPINQEELWGLGDEYLPTKPWLTFVGLSSDWNILDLEFEHKLGEDVSGLTNSLREATIAGLLLVHPGIFGIEQIMEETNYGIRVHRRWPETLRINRGVSPYILDNEIAERFKLSWPRLREIIESKDHYLRLPVTRLIDGAIRSNPRDAVIDYAVGLEALLTQGVMSELRYRFSLRGSIILNWDGGNRQDSFNKLQELYDIRSSVIHGSQADEKKINKAQSVGEEALRGVWWWFFSQDKPSLRVALEQVDARILK